MTLYEHAITPVFSKKDFSRFSEFLVSIKNLPTKRQTYNFKNKNGIKFTISDVKEIFEIITNEKLNDFSALSEKRIFANILPSLDGTVFDVINNVKTKIPLFYVRMSSKFTDPKIAKQLMIASLSLEVGCQKRAKYRTVLKWEKFLFNKMYKRDREKLSASMLEAIQLLVLACHRNFSRSSIKAIVKAEDNCRKETYDFIAFQTKLP